MLRLNTVPALFRARRPGLGDEFGDAVDASGTVEMDAVDDAFVGPPDSSESSDSSSGSEWPSWLTNMFGKAASTTMDIATAEARRKAGLPVTPIRTSIFGTRPGSTPGWFIPAALGLGALYFITRKKN